MTTYVVMASHVEEISQIVLSPQELAAIQHGGHIEFAGLSIQVEDDVLRAEGEAIADVPTFKHLLRICEEIFRLHGSWALLAIGNDQTPAMSAERRRILAEWSQTHPARGIALVRITNPLAITMLSLMMRAMNVLRATSLPIAFFRTEIEGRAWLASKRARTHVRSSVA